MRRFCLNFSFLLAVLSFAPSANGQGGLNLNQTYQDVIRLDFPAGKTQIPLPEGTWELLSLQEDQSDQVNRIWRAYLARIENGTLLGKVIFFINSDAPSYGWTASSFCEKDDHYHVVIKVNRSSDVDCWAVRRGRTRRKPSWSDGMKQMYDTLEARGVDLPYRMPIAVYIRRNDYNMLKLIYWFGPASSIVTREDVKEWAAHWKPKVDAGFEGELEKSKIARPPVSPDAPFDIAPAAGGEIKPATGGGGDIEARLTRLKKLHDEGLITNSEYAEKRQEILKGL